MYRAVPIVGATCSAMQREQNCVFGFANLLSLKLSASLHFKFHEHRTPIAPCKLLNVRRKFSCHKTENSPVLAHVFFPSVVKIVAVRFTPDNDISIRCNELTIFRQYLPAKIERFGAELIHRKQHDLYVNFVKKVHNRTNTAEL